MLIIIQKCVFLKAFKQYKNRKPENLSGSDYPLFLIRRRMCDLGRAAAV